MSIKVSAFSVVVSSAMVRLKLKFAFPLAPAVSSTLALISVPVVMAAAVMVPPPVTDPVLMADAKTAEVRVGVKSSSAAV